MRIDMGCGHRKREGCFGIDCQPLEGVDLVWDCNKPIPLPDNCADEIYAFDFLEHINNDKRIHIMEEIWRLLKNGGVFKSMTPSAEYGQGAFQDPTHYSFWSENSFLYYVFDNLRVLYEIKAKFEIINLQTSSPNDMRVCYVFADLKAVK